MTHYYFQETKQMQGENECIKFSELQTPLLQPEEDRTNSYLTATTNNNIELQHYLDDEIYLQKGSNLNPRLLLRNTKQSNRQQNYHQETSLNITFLYLQYLKENGDSIGKKILFANVILDILIRFTIFYFFCFVDFTNKKADYLFITIIQIPRLLHIFTTLKLLFMDQYELQNRSFIPISHLYRQNFISEQETKESDIKPLRYKNEILGWQSFLFVILPVEFCFLSVPKKNFTNIINTIIISSYILKSIEVVLFEPALLLEIILNFPQEKAIIILIMVDILFLVKQDKRIQQSFDSIQDKNDFYINELYYINQIFFKQMQNNVPLLLPKIQFQFQNEIVSCSFYYQLEINIEIKNLLQLQHDQKIHLFLAFFV